MQFATRMHGKVRLARGSRATKTWVLSPFFRTPPSSLLTVGSELLWAAEAPCYLAPQLASLTELVDPDLTPTPTLLVT